MTKPTNEAADQALNDLLDAERDALIAGDLEKLKNLLEFKEALVERVRADLDAKPAALEGLNGKLRRNQLLLDGALEGIRSVASRLSQLRELRGGMETYDAAGQRQEVAADPDTSVERRA